MKNYHIITEVDEMTTYFDTADTRAEATEIMQEYLDKEDPRSVKVYELDSDGEGYILVKRVSHAPKMERRPVGFGRWE